METDCWTRICIETLGPAGRTTTDSAQGLCAASGSGGHRSERVNVVCQQGRQGSVRATRYVTKLVRQIALSEKRRG